MQTDVLGYGSKPVLIGRLAQYETSTRNDKRLNLVEPQKIEACSSQSKNFIGELASPDYKWFNYRNQLFWLNKRFQWLGPGVKRVNLTNIVAHIWFEHQSHEMFLILFTVSWKFVFLNNASDLR